jgi:phage tail sheath gpL-like
MGALDIVGFTSTDFDPGWIADVRFAAGKLTAGSATLYCLLVGNMTSAGSMTPNSSLEPCFDQTQADALCGPGYELARMFSWAVKIPGVTVLLAPVTQSVGAAATCTVTYATTATSSGTWIYYVAGKLLQVPVASGDTATVQGDSFVSALAAHPEYGFTAANVTGTVTLTWKQLGPRGNDQFLRQDQSQKPTATTSTIATAGTVVTANVLIRFGGGTTADDLTTVAANLFAGWHHRPALAHRDATNLAAWETSMDSKAAWNEQHPQHTTIFFNGALAAGQSLTQTTLNNARFNFNWAPNSENDPAELAAWFAALRSVTEQSDPGADYDGVEIPDAMPYFRATDNPQRSTRVAALRTGISPVYMNGSKMTIRRAITTRCLSGSNPDYRTLDVGTAYVPDFIRFDLGLRWLDFKAKNPIIRDNPAQELDEPKAGVAWPDRWNDTIIAALKEHEAGTTTQARLPVLSDVETNLPTTIYVGTDGQEHFASEIPVKPARRQHQATAIVAQL